VTICSSRYAAVCCQYCQHALSKYPYEGKRVRVLRFAQRVINVSPLLRSDVASLDKWQPTFRNNIAFIFRVSRFMKNVRED